ncbi:hypothetical protein MesloDRAFT_1543 [Mesorhizobium japonicum R7A]|nr:hypothetical protein MesloDRAFT_1543 [Mesorhizobium japonicum R7A]
MNKLFAYHQGLEYPTTKTAIPCHTGATQSPFDANLLSHTRRSGESTVRHLREKDDAYPALIELSPNCRVISDGLVQWIIQRRNKSEWRSQSFLTSRTGLLSHIARLGLLTPSVRSCVASLPAYHPVSSVWGAAA